jgi:hypothetical protein
MPQGKGTYGSQVGRPAKKKNKLAAMYGNKNEVTRGDFIAAATKGKGRKKVKARKM